MEKGGYCPPEQRILIPDCASRSLIRVFAVRDSSGSIHCFSKEGQLWSACSGVQDGQRLCCFYYFFCGAFQLPRTRVTISSEHNTKDRELIK